MLACMLLGVQHIRAGDVDPEHSEDREVLTQARSRDTKTMERTRSGLVQANSRARPWDALPRPPRPSIPQTATHSPGVPYQARLGSFMRISYAYVTPLLHPAWLWGRNRRWRG